MARLGRVLSAAIIVGSAAVPASVYAQAGSSPRLQARDAAARAPKTAPLPTPPSITSGSIRGIVNDEHGGPVSGALVSAIGVTMASAVTDQAGRFAIDALPAGEYVVRAHLTGFTASRREPVRVAGAVATVPQLQIRRLEQVAGTSGEKTLASRPIVSAGFQLPQGEQSGSDTSDGTNQGEHPHSELAWRLRHLKRSILKNESGAVIADAEPAFTQGSILGRAVDGAAGLAAALFADVPFTGEVNLLTTSAFGPGELFGGPTLPRGIAYFAIGSPTPAGEWTVRAAMSEGDLASWVIAGSFASRAGNAHAYNIGLSYATQDYQGGNPAALAAIRDGGRNAGEVFAFDQWRVKPWVTLDYGARFARYGYLDQDRLLSPRLGLTFEPYDGTRVSALVIQRMVAPGAEEFMPRAVTGPALPPERTFAPFLGENMRAERARLLDVQLEREFGGAYVIGVRRFHQNVDDQLVTLFRVSPAGGAESVGHYYVANVGAFDADGWSFRVSSPVTARVRGSIDYAIARANWTSRDAEISRLIPALVRPESENIHDLTTSVHTNIPETATRFYVIYKINSAFSRGTAEARPGIDGRFDVQVNQALPFGVAGTKWEVLVGLRNLFRDTADPASIYDELLVVRPPKRVVGGFLVRF